MTMKRLALTTIGLLALLVGCGGGEEPSYTVDDLLGHFESNGIAVESSLDLAEVGAPSTPAGRTFLVTLSDDTELLVHVVESRDVARRIVSLESGSKSVAARMGVGDADTYSLGSVWGNVAVIIQDGTPSPRVAELREVLAR